MNITAFNPSIKNLEKTYLAEDHDAGVTTLSTKSNQNFAANQLILIGQMGQENSEVRTIQSTSGGGDIVITVATTYPHSSDDPIYVLRYDKVRFYRATAEDGSYAIPSGGTVAIDVDNADRVTVFDDTTGTVSHYYKITYYNSVSGAESNASDPIQGGRYGPNTVGFLVDAVVRFVGDTEYTILSIDEYIDLINTVNEDLLTQRDRPYRFLRTSAVLNVTADQAYIELPADYWKFRRFEFTYTVGGIDTIYRFDPEPEEIFKRATQNDNSAATNLMQRISLDEENDRISIHPTPATTQTGKVRLLYYKKFDIVDSLGDVFETPTKALYRFKLLGEFYNIKSASDDKFLKLAQKYEGMYNTEVMKLQRTNQLDAGTAKSFKWAPRRIYDR